MKNFPCRLLWILTLGCSLCLPTWAENESIDKELTTLAANLAGVLKEHSKKKVAVLDFTDLQNRQTELGRYIAEILTVEVVMQKREFTVLDRANLKRVMTEQKLTAEGLVDPENAKRLGMFTGVDAVILGTIIPSKLNVQLTAKIIATETAEIFGASRGTFRRDETVDKLLGSLEPEPELPGNGKTNAVVVSNSTSNSATNQTAKALTNAPAVNPDDKLVVIKPFDGVGLGLSLTIVNGGQYLLTLYLTNLDPRASIWVALNANNGSMTPRTILTDSEHYECRIMDDGLSGITTAYFQDPYVYRSTEIRANQSLTATAKFMFPDRRPALLGTCRLQMEFIVGHDFKEGAGKGFLHNIVTAIKAG